MESIVMFDIKELAKEVGFRKMLREIGTYKDLDEKVEAELDQLRRIWKKTTIFSWKNGKKCRRNKKSSGTASQKGRPWPPFL